MKKLEWFKLKTAALDNSRLLLLAPSDRWYYFAICCCKASAELDSDAPLLDRRIATKLRLTDVETAECKRRLMEVGLITDDWQPIGWAEHQPGVDNTATERKRRQRDRDRESQNVTRDTRDSHDTELEIELEIEKESEPVVGLNQDLPLEAAQEHGRDVNDSSERERAAVEPTAETAKTTKASRGTRLGDFPLTPERRKVAAQQGVPDHEIDNEHLLFCNHWRAKSGRDACKLDWDGTWQNWCVKSGREFRERTKREQKFSARRPDQQRQSPEDFPS